MIPLVHDFEGETVLVVGGGEVGARKARRFAREARVVVVSPEFADADFGGAELVRAAPDEDAVATWIDRTDPALVVAATDQTEVNAAIETDARDRGVLVNRADQSGNRAFGSVVVPATVRDDPVVVAITTGGQSPALSKSLRETLAEDVTGAGQMAALTADLRGELEAAGVSPDERREAIRAVVRSDRVWKALRTGESNARQAAARAIRNNRGNT